MKALTKVGLLLFMSGIFSACVGVKPEKYAGRAPVRQDVVGTWIGLAIDDLFFYRVQLNKKGGLVGSAYRTDFPIKIYEIEEWHLEHTRVLAKVKDTGTNDIKLI